MNLKILFKYFLKNIITRKTQYIVLTKISSTTIIIANKSIGKIKVIQIAGFLARRISCYVKENQNVIKGNKLGLINLGSQCVLVLPTKAKIKVKEGQQVYAAETIIAEY